jgi:hypothetical protein
MNLAANLIKALVLLIVIAGCLAVVFSIIALWPVAGLAIILIAYLVGLDRSRR